MSLKKNIETLFGYSKNPKQVPKALAKSILDELFPGHEFLGILGFGAEGCVFKTIAMEKKEKVHYAIKIAEPDFLKKEFERKGLWGERVEKINHPRVRFLNGINCQKMAAELANNPSFSLVVPQVHQILEEPWLCFRMQFIDGIPLLQFLEETKSFQASMTLYMSLLQGVQSLHAAKIIHRDLKPENIIVCGNRMLHPQICLLDWTQAKLLGTDYQNTLPGTVMGTLPYGSDKMTNEANAKEATEADDVEPCAVMCYEFVNFHKVPIPKDCRIEDLLISREAKRKYREQLREGIPEQLHPVFDCGGENKFQKIDPLIFELERAFLAMDFSLYEKIEPEPSKTIEQRLERIEKMLEKFASLWNIPE